VALPSKGTRHQVLRRHILGTGI